jgi:hypothetical protein
MAGRGLGDEISAKYFFAKNVTAAMHLRNFPGAPLQSAGIELFGENGRVKIFERQCFYSDAPMDTPNTLLCHWELLAGSLDTPYTMESHLTEVRKFAEDFLHAVRCRTNSRITAKTGYQVFEMMLAPFYAHFSEQSRIHFPLQGKDPLYG